MSKHLAVVICFALTLSACFMRHLPPPNGQLAELYLDVKGNVASGYLRLVNMGDVEMPLAEARLTITVNQYELFSGALTLGMTLYGKATEVVPFRSTLTPDRIATIAASPRLNYQITGNIALQDGEHSVRIKSHGVLTPTPGAPGRFR